MIKVHHLNNSRSQRILWLLEELELTYEIVFYTREPIGFAPAELRALHPLGKAPVVELDDGVVVAESGAAVELITSRYGGGRLMPATGTPEHARCIEVLHYAEGSLSLPLMMTLFGRAFGVDNEIYKGYVKGQSDLHLDYVAGLLGDREFMVGDGLTAADIQLTFSLQGALRSNLIGERKTLAAYVDRMERRPAYERAIEKGGPFQLGFG